MKFLFQILRDVLRGFASLGELFSPRYWRYKYADHRLANVRRYLRSHSEGTQWDALQITEQAYWCLEDEYYDA